MTIDLDKVWQVLLADEYFLNEVPEGEPQAVFRSLVDALPTLLGDLGDSPVTVESLLAAKKLVLEHSLRTDFYGRLNRSAPDALFGRWDRQEALEAVQKLAARSVKKCEAVLADVDRHLRRLSMSRSEFLAAPGGGGLGPEARQASRRDDFTIGALLEMQPSAVLKNNLF
jgi:hypothetical protein